MASEVQTFTCTVPAGTVQASPVTIDLTMPPRTVRRIEWFVPSGNRGLLGWAIGAAGVPIIPRNAGAWIVAEAVDRGWDFETPVNSGAWQFFGYNTGAYAHSVYLRFLLDPVDAGPLAYRAPVSL